MADDVNPRPSAWVMNLDAENELHARTYAPSSKDALGRLPGLVRALSSLLLPGDVIVGDADRLPKGVYEGRAWCPTPSALARLTSAGAVPRDAPQMAILRRVNHRRFAAELGQTLPGARFVTRMDELLETIAGDSPTAQWLLKRPFGFAGRGRRKVAQGPLEEAARTWVAASLGEDLGLQVEPWVELRGDFALHGHVSNKGVLVLGEPTRQDCDETGTWRSTVRTSELDTDEATALTASAEACGVALTDAGYFGPFGVDAFRWQRGAGVSFNARCELNARYSMGWATGLGSTRPDR